MEKDVINILIVDDEKYEGILMEKSVAWESEGFHIMGNVQCAEDALALMEKQTPDIVYTDINMPRIDGLELSRRIRETYPAVHIVIVTGYREFEYAREAIHIGVEEFLLKPIQSDELLAAAVKLREQILKEREQQSKDVEIYPVLCQELLRRIVTGYIKSEEAEEKLSEYQIRLWKNKGVRGALLIMDLEDHDILLKLLEIMNEALGEKNYGYFSLEKNKIFFVVEETPEIKKLLGNAFEQITELGKDGTVATSVSCYYEEIDDSPKILSECEEALVDTMRDERKTLIFYEDYIEYMQQISHSYPVNFDSYRIAVKSGDQEAAVGFIDHYLEQYIFNGPLMISQLRNLGVLLFHNTMSVLKESNKHLDNEEQVKILENISGINTLQEFCRTLYALIEGTIQTLQPVLIPAIDKTAAQCQGILLHKLRIVLLPCIVIHLPSMKPLIFALIEIHRTRMREVIVLNPVQLIVGKQLPVKVIAAHLLKLRRQVFIAPSVIFGHVKPPPKEKEAKRKSLRREGGKGGAKERPPAGRP